MSTTTVPVIDNVQAGLSRYGLGDKLRQLRRERRLRLVEVAASSGLSPSLISKLESNKLFPTLPTLWRLADALEVGLEYFFSDEHGPAIPLQGNHFQERGSDGHGLRSFDLLASASNPRFHVALVEIAPASSITSQPAGSEFLFILEGEMEVSVQQGSYRLGAGDSLYFRASAPYTSRNPGVQLCKAFLVTSKKSQRAA
jgi:transcriptional regulator with XRE-family HTH domain